MSIQVIKTYRTTDGTEFAENDRAAAYAHELTKLQAQAMRDFMVAHWPVEDLRTPIDLTLAITKLIMPNLEALKAVCDITPTEV